MRKKCGEALKSEIAFQEEVAHEIHTRYIAGGPAFADSETGETPEQFVRRPGRDFTRPRTLRFETVIQQGQLIGYVGSTGNSSGPHLHLALYYNGNPSSGGVIYAEQAWPQYKR